ncbi:hypothetical protein [Eubacterium barkeri]|uniref:Uncharacterized protein n=1 Tax=Eubacterium barkeri TaxID=1528 RepID=A0A1H3JKM5_EUBBA|nr:hypothetical protein [Eubacterium barkeri]SDY40075.1 hypothetical protein SAMN04488579_1313 [Eubacterium barkeri]
MGKKIWQSNLTKNPRDADDYYIERVDSIIENAVYRRVDCLQQTKQFASSSKGRFFYGDPIFNLFKLEAGIYDTQKTGGIN